MVHPTIENWYFVARLGSAFKRLSAPPQFSWHRIWWNFQLSSKDFLCIAEVGGMPLKQENLMTSGIFEEMLCHDVIWSLLCCCHPRPWPCRPVVFKQLLFGFSGHRNSSKAHKQMQDQELGWQILIAHISQSPGSLHFFYLVFFVWSRGLFWDVSGSSRSFPSLVMHCKLFRETAQKPCSNMCWLEWEYCERVQVGKADSLIKPVAVWTSTQSTCVFRQVVR